MRSTNAFTSKRAGFRLARFLMLASAALLAANAQPSVNASGIVNAASYTPEGMPGSGIAQGAFFAIFGTGLGPSVPQQAESFPLPTSGGLGGTTIQVAVAGTTLYAIVSYTSADQLLGILPSSTPIGAGTLTVTYNGQSSAPRPFQVVPSAFGIFAVNQGGSGAAVVTDAQYQLITPSHSAKPGDILTIWGTGIGASPGNEALGPPTPTNLTHLSVSVLAGGQAASVLYQGRSGCCSGLDQITFQMPQVTAGCAVPLAVTVGGVPSNFMSLALTPAGGTCAAAPAGAPSLPASFVSKVANGEPVTIAQVEFNRMQEIGLGIIQGWGHVDGGYALFNSSTGSSLPALLSSLFLAGPADNYGPTLPFQPGSCSIGTTLTPLPALPGTGVDAGSSLTLAAGSEKIALTQVTPGSYGSGFCPGSTTEVCAFIQAEAAETPYLGFGPLTFTGTGGTAVGAFTTAAVLAAPLANVSLPSPGSSIPRDKDLTISWTGGGDDYVVVSGSVFVSTGSGTLSGTLDRIPGYFAGFSCMANASAGSLTVPAWVLSAIPPSTLQTDGGDDLFIAQQSIGSYFATPGLDLGIFSYFETHGAFNYVYQ